MIKDSEGNIVNTTKEILEVGKKYYEDLYSKVENGLSDEDFFLIVQQ